MKRYERRFAWILHDPSGDLIISDFASYGNGQRGMVNEPVSK